MQPYGLKPARAHLRKNSRRRQSAVNWRYISKAIERRKNQVYKVRY